MRKLAIVVLLASASLGAGARPPGSVLSSAGAGISILVPQGWHLIRRPLTAVSEPAQRLAVASFAVKLASYPCDCGEPNIRDFPPAGVFLFVWEYPAPSSRAELRRMAPRPARFLVAQGNRHWYECAGPSWETAFRDKGRVFQVEVYLGPAAGRKSRARMDALLNSMQVTALRSSQRLRP